MSDGKDKGEAARQLMQQRSRNEFELAITKTFGLKDLTNKTHSLLYASANMLYGSSFKLAQLLVRRWLFAFSKAVASLKIEIGCLSVFSFIKGLCDQFG